MFSIDFYQVFFFLFKNIIKLRTIGLEFALKIIFIKLGAGFVVCGRVIKAVIISF